DQTYPKLKTRGPIVFPLMPCGSGTGDMVSLGCFATGFTPSSLTFTWNKNGTALTDFTQYPPVQKDNYYMGVSQIRVSRQDWDKREIFQCAVAHVAGKPPILKVLASSNDEKEASFSCYAKDFSPKDYDIKWLKSGEEINNKIYEIKTQTATKLENGTKLYSAASFLTVPSHDLPSHTQFTCEFKGKKDKIDVFTNSSVLYNNNVFMLPPVEHTRTETVTLTCYVKDFFPHEVFVSWLVDDEAASDSKYKFSTTNPVKNNGSYSAYGQLSLGLDEWKNNNMVYSCVVYHQSVVNNIKAIVRSIGQRTSENTNLVNLNMNIPETYPEILIDSNSAMEVEEDNMGGTALTFILLFLITLLFTIGTTVFKVTMSLYVRDVLCIQTTWHIIT
uniref:Ig-like domain-containing protein n=1 Tax=Seriola dumerili TaxID=41447 RepID=A0A3B4TLJ2_SERDU